MAYSGKYKPKNPKKYKGDFTNIVYRSMWEKYCFKWCDENSEVKSWSSEETVIPYLYEVDKKYHRYFLGRYCGVSSCYSCDDYYAFNV